MSLLKTCSAFIVSLIAALAASAPAFAQTTEEVWFAQGYGHFFIAIVAGILLAFAFQFLLSNLAVALGINMIGDIREVGNDSGSYSTSGDESDTTPTGVKITSGLGIFMLLTMTISAFFASLIAVKLSQVPDNTAGFTLGLVIWAGYLLLGLYMDTKIISGFAGSVFDAVKSTLSAGSSAIGNMFSTDKKDQAKETARETVQAIQEEVLQEYDLSNVEEKLDEYVNKLQPRRMDVDNIHEQLAQLLNDVRIKEQYTPENPESIKSLVLEVASEQPNFGEEDRQKLKNAFSKLKDVREGDGSRADKTMAAVDKLSPMDEEKSKEYRQKIEEYLRETNEEELQPEKLKEDLNDILSNPQAAPDVVQARISKIDRSTLKALLSNMQGMDDQKVEEYLDKAEEVFDSIKSKANEMQSNGGQNAMDTISSDGQSKEKAKKAIKDWFDRMGEPELRYDNLKHDARRIMDDPKAAPTVLRNRLKRLDRDSLLALVSNNRQISREQAEKVVQKIEEGRDEVLRKADEIEQKVKEKMSQARRETMRQIEGARKTAATAAWWMFLAVIVSGGASAFGGILALTI